MHHLSAEANCRHQVIRFAQQWYCPADGFNSVPNSEVINRIERAWHWVNEYSEHIARLSSQIPGADVVFFFRIDCRSGEIDRRMPDRDDWVHRWKYSYLKPIWTQASSGDTRSWPTDIKRPQQLTDLLITDVKVYFRGHLPLPPTENQSHSPKRDSNTSEQNVEAKPSSSAQKRKAITEDDAENMLLNFLMKNHQLLRLKLKRYAQVRSLLLKILPYRRQKHLLQI